MVGTRPIFLEWYFLVFFAGWLLAPSASGLWLVASGCIFLWRVSFFGMCFCFSFFLKSGADWGSFPCYLLHFGAKISHLHAHLAFGFWLCLHLALGFWFLVLVGFLALVSLGFWLLAFGRTSVECMCSIF